MDTKNSIQQRIFMKTSFKYIAFTAIMISSLHSYAGGKHINKRIHNGKNDGSLTKTERKDLREDVREMRQDKQELREARKDAREDGTVSADERKNLHEQHKEIREDKKAISKDIYEKRHNDEGVNNTNN